MKLVPIIGHRYASQIRGRSITVLVSRWTMRNGFGATICDIMECAHVYRPDRLGD